MAAKREADRFTGTPPAALRFVVAQRLEIVANGVAFVAARRQCCFVLIGHRPFGPSLCHGRHHSFVFRPTDNYALPRWISADSSISKPHGADTFVGIGPQYPWGGLYGGQIVAQSLRAAARTVEPDLEVHSLRSYFIRRGDHTEPIRFEVDRIRNGRSFSTRRVIARQAIGAILNLEASFQRPEPSIDLQTIAFDADVPGPGFAGVETRGRRRSIAASFRRRGRQPHRPARHSADVGVDEGQRPARRRSTAAPVLARLPVRRSPRPTRCRPRRASTRRAGSRPASITRCGSIAPVRADDWHLHDFSCHSFVGGRG